MNNIQCYSYGIKAISNLKKNKIPITADAFYYELHHLWDIYGEKTIEEIVKREEIENRLV